MLQSLCKEIVLNNSTIHKPSAFHISCLPLLKIPQYRPYLVACKKKKKKKWFKMVYRAGLSQPKNRSNEDSVESFQPAAFLLRPRKFQISISCCQWIIPAIISMNTSYMTIGNTVCQVS